ncbi:MAG: type II toxin-antitoxin system VapC family toxin [Verrucomicrobia bacterium]|nr:type II toxin-antitoxin system VapC family toxin [Verrucomicrobiota bacterium]MDA1065432.1 type II toxin-antitoxin system VapC family toxin [Verrucomicrobiota bacterium]
MTTYLLDTQVALWLFQNSPKITKDLKTHLSKPDARYLFHQASTWEIQIKYDLGKLPLPVPPNEYLSICLEKSGLGYRTITDAGIFMLGKLPAIHRDPFDRLLVAHAIANGWTLLTADQTLKQYPVVTS